MASLRFFYVLTPPFPLETGLESQESVRLVGRNDDFFQLEVLVQPPISTTRLTSAGDFFRNPMTGLKKNDD